MLRKVEIKGIGSTARITVDGVEHHVTRVNALFQLEGPTQVELEYFTRELDIAEAQVTHRIYVGEYRGVGETLRAAVEDVLRQLEG